MLKLAACAALGFAAGIALPTNSASKPVAVPKASAAVRVVMSNGLGSGTSIGNGNILTAAHVVGAESAAKIVLDDGKTVEGRVVWTSKTYDVALIHVDGKFNAKRAYIDCRNPRIGEAVHEDGNPAGMKFIHMSGRVSGNVQEYGPQWKSAYTVDMSVISGMSGGGLLNDAGELVGVVVGAMDPYEGKNDAHMAVGTIGFVVPSSAVCLLMGRSQ